MAAQAQLRLLCYGPITRIHHHNARTSLALMPFPINANAPTRCKLRNRTTALRSSSSSSSYSCRATASTLSQESPPSPPTPDKEAQRKAPDLQTLVRKFWKIAAPYWFSDDKVQARLRLAAVFALTLATTGISVGFSFLGRDFFNALASKDQGKFTKQLLYYLGAFAVGIPVFVLQGYARRTLALRWRCWMTSRYLQRYLKNQTFYKIQFQSVIDNPDQRIVDDLSSFTGRTLSLSLTLLNAVVDLISFSKILFTIYPPLFGVLLVYSILGTAISIFLGRELVTLNFLQEKKEADFRYGLVRVRENSESISFYGGENNEMRLLLQCFKSAFENQTKLLISSRNLDIFTTGYYYFICILPAAVVAPMYFSGKIELGVIDQSISAFNHVLGDLSLVVSEIEAISAFSAVIDRLGEFEDVLDADSSKSLSDSLEEIQLIYSSAVGSTKLDSNGSLPVDKSQKLLDVENLTVQTPGSNSTLVRDLSFAINHKEHLLVTGPSGSGKTSLLRAMGGLWRTGRGKISFYVENAEDLQPPISSDSGPVKAGIAYDLDGKLERPASQKKTSVFFLPQRPYMVLGTLRQQLLYPTWSEDATSLSNDSLPFLTLMPDLENAGTKRDKPTTEEIVQVLEDVRIGYLLPRFGSLDVMCEWSSVLSLGEQQRLAFARLLLAKPMLVLLDESTSALDEANEAHVYRLIEEAGITYISVGHRRTLYNHHKRKLNVSTIDSNSNQRNWHIESIDCDTLYNLSTIQL